MLTLKSCFNKGEGGRTYNILFAESLGAEVSEAEATYFHLKTRLHRCEWAFNLLPAILKRINTPFPAIGGLLST